MSIQQCIMAQNIITEPAETSDKNHHPDTRTQIKIKVRAVRTIKAEKPKYCLQPFRTKCLYVGEFQ